MNSLPAMKKILRANHPIHAPCGTGNLPQAFEAVTPIRAGNG
jgi:hypothetical protein